MGTICTSGSDPGFSTPTCSIRLASCAVASMTASASSLASSDVGPVAVTLRITELGATVAPTRPATSAGDASMPVASIARCATARPVTRGR